MYTIEEIPDTDSLFYRIHSNWLDEEGDIKPGAFREVGDGMSTDWSKYSSAKKLQDRANTLVNIVSLNVGGVRAINNLIVEHNPLNIEIDGEDNQAHSLVRGIPKEKILKARIRDSLIDLSNWEIQLTR